MIVAHRIALDPNNVQAAYFRRASGVARFAYNWALDEWRRQYAARKDDSLLPAPSEVGLRKQLNSIKRAQFPWMFDVTKCAPQEAIIDLGAAFRGFFEGRSAYPRFKCKDGRQSFCASNGAGRFRCSGTRIRLPIVGWVRMREALRFSGIPKRVTVSKEGDRWFASIVVDTDDVKPFDHAAELALSQRTFLCGSCGYAASRDLNAALNLERLAASSAVSACGEERSGTPRTSRVKRTSVKQEVSVDPVCVGLS